MGGILLLAAALFPMNAEERIELPAPDTRGGMSLTRSISKRQVRRSYSDQALSTEEVSQLLWAAGGNPGGVDAVTSVTRTFPSAGGIYPLRHYVAIGNVEGIEAGIYAYSPHELRLVRGGDFRRDIVRSALGQAFIGEAAVVIFISGVPSETARKYGERGVEKYLPLDIGMSAENIFLQAEALNLSTITVGAFSDSGLSRIFQLSEREVPYLLMPVGRPR